MPKYKLTYFPLMALGEPIRFLLSYMGRPFQDNRFDPSLWPQLKKEMPFGKVPVLEVDGQVLHQSAAICRYLGWQAGIAGKSPRQRLQIDIAVDTFTDFRINIWRWWHEEDEERKAKMKEVIVTEVYPYYMKRFDKLIEKNGGYIANNSLSWGDLYIVSLMDMVRGILKDSRLSLKNQARDYPALTDLEERVKQIPNIRHWIATRPRTEF